MSMNNFVKQEMRTAISKLCLAFGFTGVTKGSLDILEILAFRFVKGMCNSYQNLQESVPRELSSLVLFSLCDANKTEMKDLIDRLVAIDGMLVDDIVAPIWTHSDLNPGVPVLLTSSSSDMNLDYKPEFVSRTENYQAASNWLESQTPQVTNVQTKQVFKPRSGYLSSALLNAVFSDGHFNGNPHKSAGVNSGTHINECDDKMLDELLSPMAMSPCANETATVESENVQLDSSQHIQNGQSLPSKNKVEQEAVVNEESNANYSVSSIDAEPLKLRIRLGTKPVATSPNMQCSIDLSSSGKLESMDNTNESNRSRRKQANPQQVKDEIEISGGMKFT